LSTAEVLEASNATMATIEPSRRAMMIGNRKDLNKNLLEKDT
jgi:hypothetical protein